MSYFKRCALLTSSAIMLLISLPGHAGFSVSGTKLLEGNGNEFIMRGVNHPHTWYRNETSSFANIAATGANTVRVVLATGGQWARNDGADVADVISRCKANKLICVLEVHDSTGYTEKAEAVPITDAVNYWTSPDILSVIQGEEDYVIINIANEPYGNQASVSQYVNGHKDAIQALRAAGISHTLMVDAANWGQDWQFIMRDNAPEIFNSDPDKNILFDVHMYEVYKDASTQRAYLQAFQNHNLALVIGEFGPIHSGQTIDAQAIISQAQEFGVGYLGWSWSGNGGCCVDLDLVQNFNPNNRTSWGTLLIEGTDGIMQTSTTATIYNNGGNIAPIANFTFQATQLTVSFDSSGSRDPDNSPNALTYSWDFGDGNSSVSANPSHTYATASSTQGYSVVLTISDGQDSRSITKSVVVTDSTDPDPTPSGNCTYSIDNEWSTGFVATVTITNNGNTAISGWQVGLSYSDGSTITNGWNANITGSGPFTAQNAGWNGNIAPGQSVSFGFQGTHNGTASAATLSGSVCN